MRWPTPPDAALPPAAAGFARQWQLLHRAPLPPLLRAIATSQRWLAAWLRARAHVRRAPAGVATLDRLERELAIVMSVQAPHWPALRGGAMPPVVADLPALDPSQQLWFRDRGGALEVLLAAAFGPRDESPRAAELRARICTHALPIAVRERFRQGFGLMPPDAVVPGDHHDAIRLLQQAFADDGSVAPASIGALQPAAHEALVDVLACAVVLRAALGCSAVAAADEPTRVEAGEPTLVGSQSDPDARTPMESVSAPAVPHAA
jgi:hypothetical protein